MFRRRGDHRKKVTKQHYFQEVWIYIRTDTFTDPRPINYIVCNVLFAEYGKLIVMLTVLLCLRQ